MSHQRFVLGLPESVKKPACQVLRIERHDLFVRCKYVQDDEDLADAWELKVTRSRWVEIEATRGKACIILVNISPKTPRLSRAVYPKKQARVYVLRPCRGFPGIGPITLVYIISARLRPFLRPESKV